MNKEIRELKFKAIDDLDGLMTKLAYENDDFEIEVLLYTISERAKRIQDRMHLINKKSLEMMTRNRRDINGGGGGGQIRDFFIFKKMKGW